MPDCFSYPRGKTAFIVSSIFLQCKSCNTWGGNAPKITVFLWVLAGITLWAPREMQVVHISLSLTMIPIGSLRNIRMTPVRELLRSGPLSSSVLRDTAWLSGD